MAAASMNRPRYDIVTLARPILVVVDGSRALRRVLAATLGDQAVIQRCQYPKR